MGAEAREGGVVESKTDAKLSVRTRAFALRVIRLCKALPKSKTADIISRQILRCGASVGANYRAASRARK